MKRLLLVTAVIALLAVAGSSTVLSLDPAAAQSPIMQVDPSTLTCAGTITFDDVAGGAAPGTNYDTVFESDGADFGERFAGQTLSFIGDFDQLSGSPTSPLTLQAGSTNQNLGVYIYDGTGSQVLYGLGPLGFPNYDAIGEGSFAVLFDFDQSEFGFDLVGGNDGTATINFFKRDGTLIDTIIVTGLGTDQSYGFTRDGGVNDIAGISIHNDDLRGIGFDNLCHDVPGVPGHGVEIDIKPGSFPNSINVNSKGVLPVAILGSEHFDVMTVDPVTMLLSWDDISDIPGVPPLRWNLEDVNRDGSMDLGLKYSMEAAGTVTMTKEPPGDLIMTLKGNLKREFGGTPIEGYDTVRIINKR